ncbi:MAG: agmatinase family protein [Bacillota bacterium]
MRPERDNDSEEEIVVILPSEAEKLLLPVERPGKFVPDEYDIEVADLVKPWKEVSAADIGILGVPFDTGVMIRRGCRFGPKGIREALVFSTSYEPGLDVDLSHGITLVDFGDVDCLHTDVLGTHQRIETVVTEIFRLGVNPVILGGDHSITYATAKSLMNTTKGNIGLIMIDGHLDVRISHHGEVSSGTPFRRLLEVPGEPLKGKNLVELGINGWHNSRFYREYCREKGVTVIPARQVHQRGIEAVVQEALDRASEGTQAIFLSIDIDGLDFGAAPGTCAPNPGGLTSFQALEATWLIGRHPLVRGMDIVEVAPPLDVLGLTSMMAASLVMQYIGATKAKLDRA